MVKKIVIVFLFMVLLINLASSETKDNNSEVLAESSEEQVVEVISFESASKGGSPIQIIETVRSKRGLNISYSFDNSKYVGEIITIDLWVMSVNGSEVKRASDNFYINRAGPIKREIFIEFPQNFAGIYSIYLQVNSEPMSLIKEIVELEKFVEGKNKKSVTGKAILDEKPGRIIGYGIFVLIVIAVIFFIIMNHDKDIDKTSGDLTVSEKSLDAKKPEVKK